MRPLFAYAVSLTRDPTGAEDLVQECAVRVLTAKNVPTEALAYRAWACRILRNLFIDGLRADKRRPTEPEEEAESVVDWGSDDQMVSSITVRAAMARVSPSHQEILTLVDIVGFSYGEAAGVLDVPKGTVMSRLSRARSALLGQITGSNVHPLPLAKMARKKAEQ